MNLRDWLLKHSYRQADFADVLDIHRTHLSSIVAGTRKPGERLAKRIERATNKEILAEDILSGKAVGYEGKSKRVTALSQKPLPKNRLSLL